MIVAFKLVRDGDFQEEGITQILMEPGKLPGNSGSRNLRDVLSDLRAQVAANNSGIRLLQELVKERGLRHVEAYMHFIQRNAELTVRNMLKKFAQTHGSRARAVDYMDDGSAIQLTIDIDKETGSATFDFSGTSPQGKSTKSPTNAPPTSLELTWPDSNQFPFHAAHKLDNRNSNKHAIVCPCYGATNNDNSHTDS